MQSATLDPTMTVREHLLFIAGLSRRSARRTRQAAADALDAAGLAGAAGRRVGACSLGTQRRLDLATALLGRPRVLFLDEPTTGLDAQSRRALWERIRGLRDDGAAVLLTTQYLEEAELLADEVAILHSGRIVAWGTPAELTAHHGDLRLRFRPRGSSAPACSVAGAYLAAPVAAGPDGWISVGMPSAGAALALLDRLRDAGIDIDRFTVDHPTLEDVFLTATGPDPHGLPAELRSGIPVEPGTVR